MLALCRAVGGVVLTHAATGAVILHGYYKFRERYHAGSFTLELEDFLLIKVSIDTFASTGARVQLSTAGVAGIQP